MSLNSPGPVLEVSGLNVAYGPNQVVYDVNLSVEPGEVVALLGSNGAGKTTTLRTLSGLVRAKSGAVKLSGRDIVGLPAHEIVHRGLAHVPEGRKIFPILTVDENLTVGGYLERRDRSVVESRKRSVYELFPQLGLRKHQLAGTMSGGEQQMLAVGRALMIKPKLLALDEPSLGLAPLFAQLILRVVKQLSEEGVAVLLVEQNARQALRIARRAYVLENGRVALEGPADSLRADPHVQAAYLGGFASIAEDESADGALAPRPVDD